MAPTCLLICWLLPCRIIWRWTSVYPYQVSSMMWCLPLMLTLATLIKWVASKHMIYSKLRCVSSWSTNIIVKIHKSLCDIWFCFVEYIHSPSNVWNKSHPGISGNGELVCGFSGFFLKKVEASCFFDERIQYCHSRPYHLIWHHAFVSLSSCCAGPRWYQGGHQVSSSFELSARDMDPSLMMMWQFYHVRWLNKDQFSSQPSCNSSVDIIEVKCRISCQSSYDMMIAQPSELLTFQWCIFINWVFDNGPCQKGRVMMISFACFQVSCAWSAMAILVMICVLKKSSCSLIEKRLGLFFRQNVFNLIVMLVSVT